LDSGGNSGYVNLANSVPTGDSFIFTDGSYIWIVDSATRTLWRVDPSIGQAASIAILSTPNGFLSGAQFAWWGGWLFSLPGNGYVQKHNADGSVRYSLSVAYSNTSAHLVPRPQGMYIMDMYASYTGKTQLALINPGDIQIIPYSPSLPTVVSGLCDRAQFANYDVSQLDTSITLSMTIPAGSPARDVLSYLSKIYQFDMVDSAGQLKFVPKGQPISAVVPIEDCGFVKQTTGIPPAPYVLTRVQGSDLPRSVTLKYISAEANYTQNVRQFQISNPSGKDITASVPMTLDDVTAANAAMLLCISPHIEKTAYSWSMSFKYLWVEPGDVLQMPWGVTRITQVAIDDGQNAPFIKFQGVIDATFVINNGYGMAEAVPLPELGVLPIQPAALAPGSGQLIAGPTQGSTGANKGTLNKPPLNPGTAYGTFLEVPPLNSKQTSPYYLCYCYSTGTTFMGAAVFESTDGGSTFDQIGQQAVGGTSGFIAEIAPNTQSFTWDTSTVLSAYLSAPYMALESATDIQVLNGANLFLLGAELIQFSNAALMTDANGVPYYQLSRLLRGRRGTEWAMSSHIAGEQFTAIVDNEDVSVPYALTDLHSSNQYKVASAIQDISQIAPQAFAPTGVWFKPWSVADPRVSLDASNNWNMTFIPRARLNGFLASGIISSLDPDTQTFSIDIYSGTTLKRTVSGQLSSPSFQYTAAMQAADGFSAGAHGITFNIYQVGAQIGRGTIKTVTS
ncbi:MAG: phage tail protein, partial [Halothiobacillus sp.]|nr:phage tail protein [Halothiobacillus sp.]